VFVLFLNTCFDFVGKDHFDTKVGVSNVVSNGATNFVIIPWVHDFFIIVAFLLGFLLLVIMLLLLL
jgi:hypothetical protein